MRNWSTDTKILAQNPEQEKIWRLEQLVNFGLGEEKLSRQDLIKYLPKLHLDPQKKKGLEFLLQNYDKNSYR